MTLLTLIAGLVLLVPVAVAGVLTWRLVRRMRRLSARWRGQVPAFRACFLPPGPRRDAAKLRSTMLDELRCTQQMLAAAPDGLVFRADAGHVLTELMTAGAALDADLRAVEHFVDPAQQRAALDTLAPQVAELVETSYSARQTLLQTAAEDRRRQLSALSDYVRQQAVSADTYRRAGRELTL